MTGPDLPVEGPGLGPVHPTTSSTQPVSQKPTDTDGAAAGSWTRSPRPPPGLRDKPSSARATGGRNSAHHAQPHQGSATADGRDKMRSVTHTKLSGQRSIRTLRV